MISSLKEHLEKLEQTFLSLFEATEDGSFFDVSQEYIQGLSGNIGKLERKDKEHTDLVMSTANKIVDQLKYAMNIVDEVFKIRVLDPYAEIKNPQDQKLPAEQRYEQYLTGVSSSADEYCFQFIFAGGYRTDLTTSNYKLQDQVLADPKKLKRIVVQYRESDGLLTNIQLFDKLGKEVLKTIKTLNGTKSKEYLLEDGERIIGFTSCKWSDTLTSAHKDIQFIIGAMHPE